MSNIFTTTLRLNLDRPEDRQAFDHLRRLDKRQYRSYSGAIVTAVNAYFGRQERIAADPYLETREKEDAFLQRVMDAVTSGFRGFPVQPVIPMPTVQSPTPAPNDEDLSAALDFADSF